MHRELFQACQPYFAGLVICFLVLWAILRLSSLKPNWKRLFSIHKCEDGGVQSLSFVLTLPIFLFVVQTIVQLSQLMIAQAVVNYSAFAAARAASVWSSVAIASDDGSYFYPENKMHYFEEWQYRTDGQVRRFDLLYNSLELQENPKLKKIFQSAIMNLAVLGPSDENRYGYQFPGDSVMQESSTVAKKLMVAVAPHLQNNSRIPVRIDHKLAYTEQNTLVRFQWTYKDLRHGPTYNPLSYSNPTGTLAVDIHEVGWRDPLTVTIFHKYVLLPGPARLFVNLIHKGTGRKKVLTEQSPNGYPIYTTEIQASAMLTHEGLKSVVPYIHSVENTPFATY